MNILAIGCHPDDVETIDRETPDHDLKKAAHEELDRIAELVKEANIPVSVSY